MTMSVLYPYQSMSFEPPPKRVVASTSTSSVASDPAGEAPAKSTWGSAIKSKSKGWGAWTLEKGIKVSDNVGGKLNTFAEQRLGTEAFWPVTGDFPKEMDKCARILRAFTGTSWRRAGVMG